MGSNDEDRDIVCYVRDKIRQIFEIARDQFKHQTLIEKCKKLYKKCTDEKLFLEEFICALRYVLIFPNKPAVDNILQFVAKFIIFLYSIESNQDNLDLSDTISEACIFPSGILQFIFECHGASLLEVRLRCLQLLNKILSGMPENSTISDKMWFKLKETVLHRIQDKSPAVRAQAVLTGRKLQDPKNSDCEIIKAFLFHLNDPSSAVRRTVVSSIAFNKLTIGHVLARTRDVNDNVRRNTYIIFSKVRMLNLTIKYRLIILERGLQDRSAMVRHCVESILLVNWLENFNKDIVKFLEALDVINCTDVSLKVVENILKILPITEIISQLPLNKETRIIPEDQLTPEIALLWKSVAGYLRNAEMEEELDNILPNIITYCNFMRNFYPLETNKNLSLSKDEKWTEIKKNEILKHLLDLIKYFDFQDEMGRMNLKKLIFDMLINQRIDNNISECLIELLAPVIPSTEMFLQEVTEIISEIREPLTIEIIRPDLEQKQKMEIELNISNLKLALNELREREYNAVINKEYNKAQTIKDEIEKIEATIKNLNNQEFISQEVREEKNDPETICKCLTILVQMIKFSNVKILTPTLQNIKENFLNQCLTSQDLLTQGLSIQALGQFCALDVDIAKENLYRFILMLSERGDDEINGPALKSIFDILLVHGIKPFEKLHDCESDEEKKKKDDDGDDHDDDDDDDDEDDDDDDDDDDNDNEYSKTKKRTSLSDDGDQKSKEAAFFNEAKFIRILMELLNCKSNDLLKSIAFEGFCKLLLSGVIYSASLLEKIIIKGFSPIIDNEYEDYIRQVFMVFFPIFASSTPRSQEMIEAAFIPTMRSIILAALGTPEADINPKDVALFLMDHTRSNINEHSSTTFRVHNTLAMSVCHEILNEYDQCTELGILQFYVKLLPQLEVSLDCDSFINQIQILIRKIKKVLGDKTLLKYLNEFEKKIQSKLQNKLTSTENTSVSAKCDSEKFKEALNRDDRDSTDNISKEDRVYSSREHEKLEQRQHVRESESGDESQESEESIHSQSEITKHENNFIPESPEISE